MKIIQREDGGLDIEFIDYRQQYRVYGFVPSAKMEQRGNVVIRYSTAYIMGRKEFRVSSISFIGMSKEEIKTWCVAELKKLSENIEANIWNSRLRASLIAVINILNSLNTST